MQPVLNTRIIVIAREDHEHRREKVAAEAEGDVGGVRDLHTRVGRGGSNGICVHVGHERREEASRSSTYGSRRWHWIATD